MANDTVDGVARESARHPSEDPAQGIHRAASALRKCARQGHPVRSKAVVLLCVELLDEAVRWRDNAIAKRVVPKVSRCERGPASSTRCGMPLWDTSSPRTGNTRAGC